MACFLESARDVPDASRTCTHGRVGGRHDAQPLTLAGRASDGAVSSDSFHWQRGDGVPAQTEGKLQIGRFKRLRTYRSCRSNGAQMQLSDSLANEEYCPFEIVNCDRFEIAHRRVTVRMFPYDSGRVERDWYDVMQVCENGHIITSSAQSHPGDMKKWCPECGSATLTQCPNCNADIQGYHHIPGVIHSGPSEPPAHCHNCGDAYSWTAISNLSRSSREQVGMAQTSNIFVVHGHDDEMKQHVARTISKLGFNLIILHEQPNAGKTIIEKFEVNTDVSFAIVLMSPDDMAFPVNSNAEHAKPRSRQNVVLELGYFVGKLGRDRVFSLKRGDNLELPSDFSGVIYTAYDEAGHWKFELVRELKAAGYAVDANSLL